MTGVIRRPFGRLRQRRPDDSEHGAVATLVAILLSAGVLMGMGALVIDVGQLYLEREELQSGADAASFKVALDCVKSGACVTPTAATITTETAVATDYAGRNARDGKATAKICFKAACPTPATGTNPCSNFPSTAAVTSGNYVEVRTSTLTSGNATLIPPVFAGALAGVPYTGKNVAACARVNWGTPAVGRVLAVGISLCDWTRMTTGKGFFNPISSLVTGGVLPLLGLTYPGSTSDSAIVKNETGLGRTTCNGSPLDPLSRGFAVLNNMDGSLPDSSCQIAVNVGDSVPSNFGSDLTSGQDCLNALKASKGIAVLVPIWDTLTEPYFTSVVIYHPPTYHIVGFAPFVLTGYAGLIGGLLGTLGNVVAALLAPLFPNTASALSSGAPTDAIAQCGLLGLAACIYGYFTKSLVTMSSPVFGTGNYYGATVIGRTG